MILTAVPDIPGLPGAHHIYLIPGTPYDLRRNTSLYGIYHHFTKTNQPYAKLQSCKVDYARKIFYTYDYQYARIESIPGLDWQNDFASVTSITYLHVGVSRGFVKVAVDWVSHNIYWTDPMFRWIAMQPGEPRVTDTSLYKIIVKDDIEKPYALAVDPIGRYVFFLLGNYSLCPIFIPYSTPEPLKDHRNTHKITPKFDNYICSQTSMTRTLMTRLPWLIQSQFCVSRNVFR